MSEIVLIYPRTGFDIGGAIASPHSLLTVAAPLKAKGYNVTIIDARVNRSWREILKEVIKRKPLCIGISSMTGSQIGYSLKTMEYIRGIDREIPIIWGGPHATILPEETLKHDSIDAVVIGEGEETFLELVEAMGVTPRMAMPIQDLENIKGIGFKSQGKVIINPPRPLLDVDTLLPTPWELVNVEDYIHRDFYLEDSRRVLDIGQTSRGCPYNCGFCCSASIRKRKWRGMSVEKALEKIVTEIKRFKLDSAWIRDDNFFINEKRIRAVCSGMVRANLNIHWYSSGTRVDNFLALSGDTIELLKKSGANVLKFGAESGSNQILKLMEKGISIEQTFKANLLAMKFGLIPAFSFIAGFPTETFEEVRMTIAAIKKIKQDNPRAITESICIYTALPGTPLYKLALAHGLKQPACLEEWAQWSFHEADIKGRNPWFSQEDQKRLGNLTYISALANVVPYLSDSIDNPILRRLARFISVPLSKYFQFRLNRGFYDFSLDIKFIKFIRRTFFDADLRATILET